MHDGHTAVNGLLRVNTKEDCVYITVPVAATHARTVDNQKLEKPPLEKERFLLNKAN